MDKSTCSVAECDRPTRARGWCNAHYMYWYATREEPSGPVALRDSSRGCAVDGCGLRHDMGGYCRQHYRRIEKHGEPGPVEIRSNWAGDGISYGGMHARLRKTLGRPRVCAKCGADAHEWAYLHTDPNEKVDPDLGLPFSTDPNFYRAMCRPCHRRFDHPFHSSSQRAEMHRFDAARGSN